VERSSSVRISTSTRGINGSISRIFSGPCASDHHQITIIYSYLPQPLEFLTPRRAYLPGPVKERLALDARR
jgi:hypothetical protein